MQRLRRVLKIERFFDCDFRATANLYNHNGDIIVHKDEVYESLLFSTDLYYLSTVIEIPSIYISSLIKRKKKKWTNLFFHYWDKKFFDSITVEQLVSSHISKEEIVDAIEKSGISENSIKAYLYILKEVSALFFYSEFSLERYEIIHDIVRNVIHFDRGGIFRALCFFRKKGDPTEVHSISVMLLMLQVVSDLKRYKMHSCYKAIIKEENEKFPLNKEMIISIGMGALLHDYGKVFVNEDIVDKDSSLALGELDLIRMHPYYGVRALSIIKRVNSTILDIVGNHHFRYRVDEGKQSIVAQICNIVDIYDACRAIRPYKQDFSFMLTKEILEKENSFCKWNSHLYSLIINNSLLPFEKAITQVQNHI